MKQQQLAKQLAARQQQQGATGAREQQPPGVHQPEVQRMTWQQQPKAGSAQVLRAAPMQQTSQAAQRQRQQQQAAAAQHAARAPCSCASAQPAAEGALQRHHSGSGARVPPGPAVPAQPGRVLGLPMGHLQPAYGARRPGAYPGGTAVGLPAVQADPGAPLLRTAGSASAQAEPPHRQQQQQQRQQAGQQFAALDRLRHPSMQQQALVHQVQRHLQQGQQPQGETRAPGVPVGKQGAAPQAGAPPARRPPDRLQLRAALLRCSSAAERNSVLAGFGLTRLEAARIMGYAHTAPTATATVQPQQQHQPPAHGGAGLHLPQQQQHAASGSMPLVQPHQLPTRGAGTAPPHAHAHQQGAGQQAVQQTVQQQPAATQRWQQQQQPEVIDLTEDEPPQLPPATDARPAPGSLAWLRQQQQQRHASQQQQPGQLLPQKRPVEVARQAEPEPTAKRHAPAAGGVTAGYPQPQQQPSTEPDPAPTSQDGPAAALHDAAGAAPTAQLAAAPLEPSQPAPEQHVRPGAALQGQAELAVEPSPQAPSLPQQPHVKSLDESPGGDSRPA
ncbi:hypothetical protein ABPG77_009616 [Micractinium sp. CCAP 211/92]